MLMRMPTYSYNVLERLPPDFGNISTLTKLNLCHNRLERCRDRTIALHLIDTRVPSKANIHTHTNTPYNPSFPAEQHACKDLHL